MLRGVECGYAWDDDDECGGPVCELEKGHAGAHWATWETRPLDICLAEGHLWDLWQTYLPERHFGSDAHANLEWKLMPMRERLCLRCGRQDYDGGERNPDISELLLASIVGSPAQQNLLGHIDVMAGAKSVTWVEDRLNPRPWRPE